MKYFGFYIIGLLIGLIDAAIILAGYITVGAAITFAIFPAVLLTLVVTGIIIALSAFYENKEN